MFFFTEILRCMNIILFSSDDKYTDEKDDIFCFFKNDERFIHIKKILKLRTGGIFKAGIINGNAGIAKIQEFTQEKILFSFSPSSKKEAFYPVNIVLGFPRPIQLKRILRDISSMGIKEIYLTGTELGEKSYRESALSKESEIIKYLIDGCSQAGSTLLPKIFISNSVKDFLSNYSSAIKTEDIKFIFDVNKDSFTENSESFLMDSLQNTSKAIWLAIGSERGWTEKERGEFKKKGFKTISLGNRILRTETAATAAFSYILTKFGFYK